MGYCSEVVIAVSKEAMVRSLISGLPGVLSEADEHIINEKGSYWRFSSVKWYSSYEEVQEVRDWLNELPLTAGHDFEYAFVRIGEEDTDIETDGDLDAFDINIEVVRRIEAPI